MSLEHGSPERSAAGCGCLACARQVPAPNLRWPINPLIDAVGLEVVREGLDTKTWTNYRANGVPDYELDSLCVKYKLHPGWIYQGWFEAGLDPEDETE